MGNSAPTPVDMNSEEAVYVQNTIDSNCVVIFSKTYCPYCDTAKKIFSKLQVSPKIIELDNIEGGSQMQNILEHMTNARTVPRVFINGKCIGGASETKSLNNSGKLQSLLNDCSG
ncbi:hypothetical protein SNE40_003068 [Patella caerulea]|uniref:Glutaredoxin-2, mitochondrial n=1 Tax=Patella caerulea TaxID=87958 RepID=A0AAN8KDF9_PATCE